MNRENQIAMFKPNVRDLRNLENIGIKPKEKGERDDFVMDCSKVRLVGKINVIL